jgi:hypothetical protein
MLAYTQDERISARKALRHPYFRDLRVCESPERSYLSPSVYTKSRANITENEEEEVEDARKNPKATK